MSFNKLDITLEVIENLISLGATICSGSYVRAALTPNTSIIGKPHLIVGYNSLDALERCVEYIRTTYPGFAPNYVTNKATGETYDANSVSTYIDRHINIVSGVSFLEGDAIMFEDGTPLDKPYFGIFYKDNNEAVYINKADGIMLSLVYVDIYNISEKNDYSYITSDLCVCSNHAVDEYKTRVGYRCMFNKLNNMNVMFMKDRYNVIHEPEDSTERMYLRRRYGQSML